MPVHNWSRVDSFVFADFQLRWTTHLAETLNATFLPDDYYVLVAREPNRRPLVIRHCGDDRIVARFEIASPAKNRKSKWVEDFVDAVVIAMSQHVHVSFVDMLPRTTRGGLHSVIWQSFEENVGDVFQPEKPLIVAAYQVTQSIEAFVRPFAVGDLLPSVPLFLDAERFIELPLDATYQSAYRGVPKRWRDVIEASG